MTGQGIRRYAMVAVVWLCAPLWAGERESGIIYQGQLKDGGVPANGSFDFLFSLYNSEIEGEGIGRGVQRDPVEVVGGLFQVSLDFGEGAFNGEPRWLEIAVRTSGDRDPHVPLSPRQRVAPAPYALALPGLSSSPSGLQIAGDIETSGSVAAGGYGSNLPAVAGGNCDPNILGLCNGNNFVECARIDPLCNFGIGTSSPMARLHVAGTPGVDGVMFPDGTLQTTAATGGGGNGHWTADGDAITNSNAGFVGINRSTTVNSNEYFGIQVPATGTEFGGMYIRTDSGTARPFYGYRAGLRTATHYLDGDTGNWHLISGGGRMTVTATGRVGVGTNAPENARLHVALVGGSGGEQWAAGRFVHEDLVESGYGVYASTNSPDAAAVFGQSQSDTSYGGRFFGGACTGLFPCGPALQVFGDTHLFGPVGVNTFDPSAPFHVNSNSDAEPESGGIAVFGSITGGNVVIDGNEIMARNNGATSTLFLNNDGGDVHISQGAPSGGSGRLVTPILQITGGSDLSEHFDVASEEPAEPGTLVCIDPAHPGKLARCAGAYDRRVAGVISGAGGIRTGMLMGQAESIADGQHPVALSGRVYCLADAGDGAISPGDLLTTSDVAGHAMRVADNPRAQGAIIGKAMTALARGERGLVLVLVSLQ